MSLIEKIDLIFSLFVKFMLVVIFILLFFLTYPDTKNPGLVIEPLNVPKKLIDKGVTGKVLSERIAATIDRVRVESIRTATRHNIAHSRLDFAQTDIPDPSIKQVQQEIVVPGAGFTLHTFYKLLGISTLTTIISGELVIDNSQNRLTLRVKLAGIDYIHSREFQANGIDSVLRQAGIFILEVVEPRSLGMRYYAEQNFVSLRRILRQQLAHPQNQETKSTVMLLEGLLYLRDPIRELKQALKRFEKAYEFDSSNTVALRLTGEVQQMAGEPEKAIEIYKRLLDTDKNFHEAKVAWADAFLQEDKESWAAHKFNEAFHTKLNKAWIYTKWGDAIINYQGDKEANLNAEEKYRKAIEYDPTYLLAYDQLSNVLIDQEKFDEAIKVLQSALPYETNPAWSFNNIGHVFSQQGQHEKAKEYFQMALKKDSDNPLYLANIASTCGELGEHKRALEYLNRAAQNENAPSWIFDLLGDKFSYLGMLDEAIDSYEKAIKLSHDLVSSYASWGATLCGHGHYKEGLQKLEQAKDLDVRGEFAWIHIDRGYCLYGLKRFDEAINAAKASIEIDSNSPKAYILIGDSRYMQQQFSDAETAFQEALYLNQKELDAYVGLGYLFLEQELYTDSQKSFNSAIIVDPKSAFAYAGLGHTLKMLGDTKGGLKKYAEGILSAKLELQGNAMNAELHSLICWLGGLSGKSQEVIKSCDEAVKLRPINGDYKDCRGLVRAINGDLKGAIEDFEFLIKWAEGRGLWEKWAKDREEWITALKSHRNPFNKEKLETIW